MRYILILSLSTILLYCSTGDDRYEDIKIMDEQTQKNIQTISNAKIFFGHQSVGFNIMSGLAVLNKNEGGQIKIIEEADQAGMHNSYFLHSKNGENEKPKTKCDGFNDILSQDFASELDVALFKFCYIDINESTNINELFDYYKKTMAQIRKDHPGLLIVHVTVPLRLIQSGWKATIKKIMGKELGGVADNIKRNQFNELLYSEYAGKPIYDLAKIESTYSNGRRSEFEIDGTTYYSMVPAYTSDSGHLNGKGSILAAKELLKVLAETIMTQNINN